MQGILILGALGWVVLNVFVPLLIPLTVIGLFVYYFFIEPSSPPSSLKKQEKLVKKHFNECDRILREDATRFDLIKAERRALSKKLQLSQRMQQLLNVIVADDASNKEFEFSSDGSDYILRTCEEGPSSSVKTGIEVLSRSTNEPVYRAMRGDTDFETPVIFLAGSWLYPIVRVMKEREDRTNAALQASTELEKQQKVAAQREDARKKFG